MDIPDLERTLHILAHGRMAIHGQFVRRSNATLYVHLQDKSEERWAVYKPRQGETPLWDFPDGSLAAREVAAYLVSEMLSWNLVPPTVFRRDAPYGEGSVQQFFHYDPDLHYFTFDAATRAQLDRVVLFDLLINNADRKASHILLDDEGRLWLIDHGLTFHHEPKLRTVIWEFAGKVVPSHLKQDIERLIRNLTASPSHQDALLHLMTPLELEALLGRAKRLLTLTHFPEPGERRAFPYPLI